MYGYQDYADNKADLQYAISGFGGTHVTVKAYIDMNDDDDEGYAVMSFADYDLARAFVRSIEQGTVDPFDDSEE